MRRHRDAADWDSSRAPRSTASSRPAPRRSPWPRDAESPGDVDVAGAGIAAARAGGFRPAGDLQRLEAGRSSPSRRPRASGVSGNGAVSTPSFMSSSHLRTMPFAGADSTAPSRGFRRCAGHRPADRPTASPSSAGDDRLRGIRRSPQARGRRSCRSPRISRGQRRGVVADPVGDRRRSVRHRDRRHGPALAEPVPTRGSDRPSTPRPAPTAASMPSPRRSRSRIGLSSRCTIFCEPSVAIWWLRWRIAVLRRRSRLCST